MSSILGCKRALPAAQEERLPVQVKFEGAIRDAPSDDPVPKMQSMMEVRHIEEYSGDDDGAGACATQDAQEAPGKKAPKRPALPPPCSPQPIPCPRCGSEATKFCYYNNYDPQQPRNYCKDCQRYWTVGGVLRNVPPGSGRRKSRSAASRENRRAIASNLVAAVEDSTNSGISAAHAASELMQSNPLASMLMSNLGLGVATVPSIRCGRPMADANSLDISNQTASNTQCLHGPACSLSHTNVNSLLVTPSLLAHLHAPVHSERFGKPQHPAVAPFVAVSNLKSPVLQPQQLAVFGLQRPAAPQPSAQRAPSAFTQHTHSSCITPWPNPQRSPSAFTQHTSAPSCSTEGLIPTQVPRSTGDSQGNESSRQQSQNLPPLLQGSVPAAAAPPLCASDAACAPAEPSLHVQLSSRSILSPAEAAPLCQSGPSVLEAAPTGHKAPSIPEAAPLSKSAPSLSEATTFSQNAPTIPSMAPLSQNVPTFARTASLSQNILSVPGSTPLGQSFAPLNLPTVPTAYPHFGLSGNLASSQVLPPVLLTTPQQQLTLPMLNTGLPGMVAMAPSMQAMAMAQRAWLALLPGSSASAPSPGTGLFIPSVKHTSDGSSLAAKPSQGGQ
jgi:hypothetical protein